MVGFPYRFADLSLEGAFLMGLLGGRVVGPIGGAIITIPALMGHEWLGMPAAATAGLLGGLMRQAIPNKEDLWNFGPFTFLNIPRDLLRLARQAKMSWELLPLLACVGLELGRVALVMATTPKWLFAIDPHWNWWLMLTVLATVMSVAAPLKIWNNTRIEMNLERHQQLLLKARMDALSSQINPHFLFNTLNTVSSLIRFDPDMARGVVLKLSNILRRLLRKHETFVPLKEELDFIDDYLDIEVARFGRDNLEFLRKVDDAALEAFVPSMLAATDRRELLEARPGVETRRRPHPTAHHQPRRAPAHRDRRQRRGNLGREDAARLCRRHWSEQCARAPARLVRRRFPPGDRKPPRRRHADPHRHS